MEAAKKAYEAGKHVILCRQETSPEDIVGLRCAVGVLTMRGGMTSHAAVIARFVDVCSSRIMCVTLLIQTVNTQSYCAL